MYASVNVCTHVCIRVCMLVHVFMCDCAASLTINAYTERGVGVEPLLHKGTARRTAGASVSIVFTAGSAL